MQDVTATYRNGSTAQLANIYIRGTQIKIISLPKIYHLNDYRSKIESQI